MPKIIVKTPFHWSPDGKQVLEIPAGEQDVPERCATVAVDQLKVATRAGGKTKAAPSKAKAEPEGQTAAH